MPPGPELGSERALRAMRGRGAARQPCSMPMNSCKCPHLGRGKDQGRKNQGLGQIVPSSSERDPRNELKRSKEHAHDPKSKPLRLQHSISRTDALNCAQHGYYPPNDRRGSPGKHHHRWARAPPQRTQVRLASAWNWKKIPARIPGFGVGGPDRQPAALAAHNLRSRVGKGTCLARASSRLVLPRDIQCAIVPLYGTRWVLLLRNLVF